MGLQRKPRADIGWFPVVLAVLGLIGSVFTFLSMFGPLYLPMPVYYCCVLGTAFFSFHALHPGGKHLSMLPVLGGYGLAIWFLREHVVSGLMLLMNRMYQSIYLTDWTFFDIEFPPDEAMRVTVFLCVVIVPVAGLLSYAVVRYHNFFLSFLVTFPIAELGFFFGMAPHHGFASLLLAFWCASAALQLSGAGALHGMQDPGFLRRRGRFYPAAGMRFLLSRRASLTVFVLALLLCMGAQLLLDVTHYERPDAVRGMRTYYLQYASSIDWSDRDSVLDFFKGRSGDLPDREEISLGNTDAQEYEDVAVTSVAFSGIPQGRVYLRLRSAHAYNSQSWTGLPEEAYADPVFDVFDALDFHPPEFLYYTGTDNRRMRMSMYNTTDTLGLCVPYGFLKSEDVTCRRDDSLDTGTTVYTFSGGTDYEEALSMAGAVEHDRVEDLLPNVAPEHAAVMAQLVSAHPDTRVWVQAKGQLLRHYYAGAGNSTNTAEAAILCGCGYSDAVFANETALPDSPALDAVRAQYADLFAGFDARTASPARTIDVLRQLRDRVCREVTYDLAPGRTPADQDFTAFFLLENRRGYCQHYATAGTVLARMAGIPARYCEGYMIDCSRPGVLRAVETPDGIAYTADVLDSNAHAWTEIYLDGIGWIPFEFTYSYFTPAVSDAQSVPPAPAQAPTQAAAAPTQASTEAPAKETVPVTPAQPSDDMQPDPGSSSRVLGTVLRVLIVLAVCLAAVTALLVRHNAVLRRDEAASSQADARAAAQHLWHRTAQMLSLCGVPPDEPTLAGLEEECFDKCADLLPEEELRFAAEICVRLRYSNRSVTPEELEALRQVRMHLTNALRERSGVRRKLYMRWILHLY
ncbi:MAG: transglutaminase domain-containing protein [Oscillospiraceae bacterium]|nr:transglutaminase domain-containing protein [Oscillospiraceae bacterium]